MDLKILQAIPPWEWPENTTEMLLGILEDDHAEESDRILAASFACDYTVLSDRIAEALTMTEALSDDDYPDEEDDDELLH